MKTVYNLKRYIDAQEPTYRNALAEIKNGKKESHWIWFIFPQIAGLEFTGFNIFYAIQNQEEAREYLNHPVLGKRLIEISEAILIIENKTALEILGKQDAKKLHSCMTLFNQLSNPDKVFQAVLNKFYNGRPDEKTLKILQSQKSVD